MALVLAAGQMPNDIGYIEPGKKRAKKTMDIELHGLWGRDTPSPLVPQVIRMS